MKFWESVQDSYEPAVSLCITQQSIRFSYFFVLHGVVCVYLCAIASLLGEQQLRHVITHTLHLRAKFLTIPDWMMLLHS